MSSDTFSPCEGVIWYRKCKDGTWNHDFINDNPYDPCFCDKCNMTEEGVATPRGGFIQ